MKSTTEGNVDDGKGENRARAIKVFLTRLRSRSVDQLLGVPSIRRVDPRSVLGETRYIKEGSDIKDSCWERVSRFDHRALSRLATWHNGCQTLAVFRHFLKPGVLTIHWEDPGRVLWEFTRGFALPDYRISIHELLSTGNCGLTEMSFLVVMWFYYLDSVLRFSRWIDLC